jgi:hypothetical protein
MGAGWLSDSVDSPDSPDSPDSLDSLDSKSHTNSANSTKCLSRKIKKQLNNLIILIFWGRLTIWGQVGHT